MNGLWDHISLCHNKFEENMMNKWQGIDSDAMESEVKALQKQLKDKPVEKKANAYMGINDEIKKWLTFLPLVTELSSPAMRDRHWD